MAWYDVSVERDDHEEMARFAIEATNPADAEKIARSIITIDVTVEQLYVEPDEFDNPEFDGIYPAENRRAE